MTANISEIEIYKEADVIVVKLNFLQVFVLVLVMTAFMITFVLMSSNLNLESGFVSALLFFFGGGVFWLIKLINTMRFINGVTCKQCGISSVSS